MLLTFLNSLLIIGVLYHYGFVFNITNSLPVGLYRLVGTDFTKGDVVAFCLNDESSAFLRSRGGIPVKHGQCGDHPYLFKKVYGVPGDHISQNKSVFVNRVKIPGVFITGDKAFKKAFGPLTADYRLAKDQFFLISADHPNSFDSRYFGAVNKGRIFHKVVPIWTV